MKVCGIQLEQWMKGNVYIIRDEKFKINQLSFYFKN